MRAVRVDLGILLLCYIGGARFISGVDPWLLALFFGGLYVSILVFRGGFFWILLGLLFGVLGAWRWSDVHGWKPELYASEELNGVVAVLVNNPSKRTASWRVEVEIVYVPATDSVNPGRTKYGGALLYFSLEDSLARQLCWGDTLVVRASLRRFEAPLNPGAFNYARYQWKRGVFYTAFVAEEQWARAGCFSGRVPAMVWMRDSLRTFIYGSLTDSVVADVAMGFMLGDRSEIDPTSVKAFSVAGAMHVMAVSGLHVGLVYVLLYTLIPFASLRPLGVLLGVWFYAGITGMSASAVRASTMLSMLLLGRLARKKIKGHQTLLLAAFILLLIDPMQYEDLGFQLSFAAVGGILLFQPLFEQLYDPTTPWKRWIWGLVTVSISAQAATWPLSAHVFHLFPTYFLFTNLWVIPWVTALLYSGIAVLSIHGLIWPMYSLLNAWSWAVHAMVRGVEWVGTWPAAAVEGIVFNRWAVLLSYCLLVTIYLLVFAEKSRKYTLLLCYVILLCWVVQRDFARQKLNKMQGVFYSDRKWKLIGLVGNRAEELIVLSDTAIPAHEYSYTVRSHWKELGVRMHTDPKFGANAWELLNYRILHMHPDIPGLSIPMEEQIDVIYWSGRWRFIDLAWLQKCRTNLWIIHPSMPPWNVKTLLEFCEEQGQSYHLLSRGALTVDLDLDPDRPVHRGQNHSRP